MSTMNYVPVLSSPAGRRIAPPPPPPLPGQPPPQPEIGEAGPEKQAVVSKYRVFDPPEGHRHDALRWCKQAQWRRIRQWRGLSQQHQQQQQQQQRTGAAGGDGGGGRPEQQRPQRKQQTKPCLRGSAHTCQVHRAAAAAACAPCGTVNGEAGAAFLLPPSGAAVVSAAAAAASEQSPPENPRSGPSDGLPAPRAPPPPLPTPPLADQAPPPPDPKWDRHGCQQQGKKGRLSSPEAWESEALCEWRTPPASAHFETKDLFAVLHARRARPPTGFTPRGAVAKAAAAAPRGKRRRCRSPRAPASVLAARAASPPEAPGVAAAAAPDGDAAQRQRAGPESGPGSVPAAPQSSGRSSGSGPPAPSHSSRRRGAPADPPLGAGPRVPRGGFHQRMSVHPAPFERAPTLRDGREPPNERGRVSGPRGGGGGGGQQRPGAKSVPGGTFGFCRRFFLSSSLAVPGRLKGPSVVKCASDSDASSGRERGTTDSINRHNGGGCGGGEPGLQTVRQKNAGAGRRPTRDIRGMLPPLAHRGSRGALISHRRPNHIKMGVEGESLPIAPNFWRGCLAENAASGAAKHGSDAVSSGGENDASSDDGYSEVEDDLDGSDIVSDSIRQFSYQLLAQLGCPVECLPAFARLRF